MENSQRAINYFQTSIGKIEDFFTCGYHRRNDVLCASIYKNKSREEFHVVNHKK